MEIESAKGSYIYDKSGKAYLDFVAGVSACTLGHSNPIVNQAIKEQVDSYSHVMVYGEYIQDKPLELCKLLAKYLPSSLDTTYLTNSGTEAVEGALKLARRVTGRSEIIAAKHAYHGNTMGAMSVMGYEERKQPFRPLIPDVRFINFNDISELENITNKTAGVILETIQGGAGFIEPVAGYLEAVQKRCNEVGALFILDEIQTGIGRTGKLFGFENYNCEPDVVVCGKGLGGGMPVGAFIASNERMSTLKDNPKLGHITTFGGHPVISAAGFATLEEVISSNLMAESLRKEVLIRKHLSHPLITEIRGKGLMLAVMTPSKEVTDSVILDCQDNGLILFWLLYEPKAIRITPPLTISDNEIVKGCETLKDALNKIVI
jgi:acetylornithine/succinyldiaminopimelate/putrescine aminotransferase